MAIRRLVQWQLQARMGSMRTVLVVLCVLMASSPAPAQVGAGAITGVIKDPAGAVVPGATVTVTGIATNFRRVVVSTSDGVYTAASLTPGIYRIDVDLQGFRPVRRAGIHLATGETARIDFALGVGDVREHVTVTADSPMVRSETASRGTVIEHEQVVQRPLNGRTFS